MDTFQSTRRGRQVRAERVADKVRANNTVARRTDSDLWREVKDALRDAENLRRLLGHFDKIATVVIAQSALEELRMRGTQTELPI